MAPGTVATTSSGNIHGNTVTRIDYLSSHRDRAFPALWIRGFMDSIDSIDSIDPWANRPTAGKQTMSPTTSSMVGDLGRRGSISYGTRVRIHTAHRTPRTAHHTPHTSSHLCFTPPDSSQCPARHNDTSHDTVITVSVFVSWQDPIPFPFIHNFEPSMGTWLGTRIGVWDSYYTVSLGYRARTNNQRLMEVTAI